MTRSPNTTQGRDRKTPLWRRLAWFVALWGAGVAVVALVSLLLRAWLSP